MNTPAANATTGSVLSPQLKEQLAEDGHALNQLTDEMGKVVVGQQGMTRSLVIGLVTGGHVLLEGLPGLAKTLAVKTLASVLDAKFQRIQFTPDLLPSDLIGTVIYREETREFVAKKGPIFANIVLADEINRAPAKVQSALLEAMAEKQVTIGETTFPLSDPFLVLATQNPIEQEGTYLLPEAQLDRFLFKIKVGYPSRQEERAILERMAWSSARTETQRVFPAAKILEIRKRADQIYVDDRIKEYIVRLVLATRKEGELTAEEVKTGSLTELRNALTVGASPRATLMLTQSARTAALLEQRHYVTPEDVKSVAYEVLRHRLILTFDAQAKNLTTDDAIRLLLETVTVP